MTKTQKGKCRHCQAQTDLHRTKSNGWACGDCVDQGGFKIADYKQLEPHESHEPSDSLKPEDGSISGQFNDDIETPEKVVVNRSNKDIETPEKVVVNRSIGGGRPYIPDAQMKKRIIRELSKYENGRSVTFACRDIKGNYTRIRTNFKNLVDEGKIIITKADRGVKIAHLSENFKEKPKEVVLPKEAPVVKSEPKKETEKKNTIPAPKAEPKVSRGMKTKAELELWIKALKWVEATDNTVSYKIVTRRKAFEYVIGEE